MPDLKTEMTKVIEAWNNEEPTITSSAPPKPDHRITNNVSRITFNLVRDSPGITRQNAVTRLTASGYKESSVTSLLTQYVRGGLVRADGDKLYATRAEYSTTYQKSRVKTKPRAKAKTKEVAAKPEPIAAPTPAKPAVFISRHVDFDPKRMIGTLSVYHARELYNELKEMFGG